MQANNRGKAVAKSRTVLSMNHIIYKLKNKEALNLWTQYGVLEGDFHPNAGENFNRATMKGYIEDEEVFGKLLSLFVHLISTYGSEGMVSGGLDSNDYDWKEDFII